MTMGAMAAMPGGATQVLLARAGRSHVPEKVRAPPPLTGCPGCCVSLTNQVDEAVWCKLSCGSVADGLKYSLVAGGVVMKRALDQLQQVMRRMTPPTVGGVSCYLTTWCMHLLVEGSGRRCVSGRVVMGQREASMN